MSKFHELHQHLQECVDGNDQSFIGVTEHGVEFNMFEWAYGLSLQAKKEHNRLTEENKRLREALLLVLDAACQPYSCSEDTCDMVNQLLSELGG